MVYKAGFQIRTFFAQFSTFSGEFFAQIWGPRDGPKARDGNHVST